MKRKTISFWIPKQLHKDYRKACKKLYKKMCHPVIQVMEQIIEEAKHDNKTKRSYYEQERQR